MTTAPKPTTPPSAPATTTVRLFLVDDHPLLRDGLRARLGSMTEGYKFKALVISKNDGQVRLRVSGA